MAENGKNRLAILTIFRFCRTDVKNTAILMMKLFLGFSAPAKLKNLKTVLMKVSQRLTFIKTDFYKKLLAENTKIIF